MLRNMTDTHTSSEAAILWFLKAHELEHGRGASKADVMLYARVSERTFARAWPKLERAGLVRTELRITDAGVKHLKTG
jgi:hypothetical protein